MRNVRFAAIILVAFASGLAVMAGIVFLVRPNSTDPVAQAPRTATPTPPPRSVVPPVSPSVTPTGVSVDFDLVVSQVVSPKVSVLLGVTLQATLNASLTNLGDSDAHNVLVQLRARVGNTYLKLNDAEPLVVRIGDLPGRATATQVLPIEIKMSLIQGNQAQTEGIVFETTVLSTERTKRFPDMLCTQTGCSYQ